MSSLSPNVKKLVELVLTVAIALGLALGIQAFLVKPYRIPSGSMEPTLDVGQRVLVNRLSGDPKIGDIVVFNAPKNATGGQSGVVFIKRVVGMPGDHLRIKAGHVIRNGRRERDGYIAPCNGGGKCDVPTPVTVPAHHVYVMGDNRGNSDDSRYWGPLDEGAIIGKAFATYWPPGRIGTL